MCLGSRIKVKEIIYKNPTLLGFTNNLILPFLYSFTYLVENGSWPYGELSHGSKGLVEDYQERYGLKNEDDVIDFLQYILHHPFYHPSCSKYVIRSRSLCLCNSGKRFGKCHKKYNYLTEYYSQEEIIEDIVSIKTFKTIA